MHKSDFWTNIVVAVAIFLASLPVLLQPWQGITNNHGPFKLLLIIGPLAMILLTLIGYRRTRSE